MNKLLFSLFLISFTSCQDNFDLKIKEEIKKTKIPAVVMGKVTKDGGMQFFSKGPSRWDRSDTINENNIFRIASMTKALGSVAALQLVEDGKITLDEPLDKHLPEMSLIKILDKKNQIVNPEKSITLRHLLTHTAGFGYWFTSNKLSEWDELKKLLNLNTYQKLICDS